MLILLASALNILNDTAIRDEAMKTNPKSLGLHRDISSDQGPSTIEANLSAFSLLILRQSFI